jgi:hypothetical protein
MLADMREADPFAAQHAGTAAKLTEESFISADGRRKEIELLASIQSAEESGHVVVKVLDEIAPAGDEDVLVGRRLAPGRDGDLAEPGGEIAVAADIDQRVADIARIGDEADLAVAIDVARQPLKTGERFPPDCFQVPSETIGGAQSGVDYEGLLRPKPTLAAGRQVPSQKARQE